MLAQRWGRRLALALEPVVHLVEEPAFRPVFEEKLIGLQPLWDRLHQA